MGEEKGKLLTRKDVLRLIEENGGTAKGLDLSECRLSIDTDLSNLDLSGIILDNAKLAECHLERIDLTDAHLKWANLERTHLEGARLFGAHLEEADLVGAHLEGADLMSAHLERAYLMETHLEKANLVYADLKDADLTNAHLEGAYINWTKITEASIGTIDWGNYIIGEEMEKNFYAARHCYRHLKNWYTKNGYYDIAAKFYYREMEAKRKALKWRSKHCNDLLALEILRVLFGYGERWRRVLVSIAVLILLFALTYCVIGSVWEWSAFWNSLYFSAVSFTALGYGSWVQVTNGWIKGIGAFESLVGVSMMALLLVTFFRKWTR